MVMNHYDFHLEANQLEDLIIPLVEALEFSTQIYIIIANAHTTQLVTFPKCCPRLHRGPRFVASLGGQLQGAAPDLAHDANTGHRSRGGASAGSPTNCPPTKLEFLGESKNSKHFQQVWV